MNRRQLMISTAALPVAAIAMNSARNAKPLMITEQDVVDYGIDLGSIKGDSAIYHFMDNRVYFIAWNGDIHVYPQ